MKYYEERMPIFGDAYQTTVGSVVDTKQTQKAIIESIIKDGVQTMTLNVDNQGDYNLFFITGKYDSEDNIPLFTHPIVIKHNNQNYLVSDLRYYIRKTDIRYGMPVQDSIRNRTEFNFAKSVAVLTLAWLNGENSSIKTNLSFAGSVYANWISEMVRKTYALDFKDSIQLTVIAHYFYQSLFVDQIEVTEDMKQKWVVHTIKATGLKATDIFEIYDTLPGMKNIEDFCHVVSKNLENVRLSSFNLPTLLTILSNSWYGTNAKEVIRVALEHPPTWNALVYTALSERTYKNSVVYRVAERLGKRGVADEYMRNYKDFVYSYTGRAE